MAATIILIDLDTIVDTRLGTLALINQDAAQRLLQPVAYDAYLNRKSDDWFTLTNGAVSNDVFTQRYKARDVTTLRASLMTNFSELLSTMVDDLEQQMIHTPQVSSVEVHVNYWPYVLDKEELDAYELCVSQFAGVYTTVKMVNYPPHRITPQYLDKVVSGYITYSFNEWLSHHHYALTQCAIPNVILMAAALYLKEPTEKELTEVGVKDFFMATEHIFITQLKLVLVCPEFYSIITL